MWSLLLSVLFACAPPEGAVFPDLSVPPDTLVFREHLVGAGPERTGNWWYRFDARGCFTQGHNTWLWVHDPVLLRSTDRLLHFNGEEPGPTWFCLTDRQRAKLVAAVRTAVTGGEHLPAHHGGPVDRWTISVGGQRQRFVVPEGGDAGALFPVLAVLAELARAGVWGQSPEPDEGSSEHPAKWVP